MFQATRPIEKTPLEAQCARCGATNQAGARACGRCHAVLKVGAAQQGLASRAVPPATPLRPAKSVVHALLRPGAPPIHLVPGRTFTLGRLPECTFVIDSPKVSRRHAEVRWDGEKPVLFDTSTYGTFVNGKLIASHPLGPGDEIRLGPFVCEYQNVAAPPRRAPPSPSGSVTCDGMDAGIAGSLRGSGLAELLQSFEFNKKTGTLVVFGLACGRRAFVTLRDGAPLMAEFGELHDEDAVLALLRVREGRFNFCAELLEGERRMRAPITALLLEAGRRSDEESHEETRNPIE